MTFIEQALAQIDERLAQDSDEIARLEAARQVLISAGSERAASRNARAGARSPAPDEQRRRPLTPRQVQALALVESKPGISAAELSRAMGSNSYGYIVVKSLSAGGYIAPCEGGWQAAAS